MLSTTKELKETKNIINILTALFFVLLFVSILSLTVSITGQIYSGKDDLGELIGINLEETVRLYHIIFGIASDQFANNYFDLATLLVFIFMIVLFVLSFIKYKKHGLPIYISIGSLMVVAGVVFILLINGSYYFLKDVFLEFASTSYVGSYANVSREAFPILVGMLVVISGFLVALKGYVAHKLRQIQLKGKTR